MDDFLKTSTICLHTQLPMRDERYFSSQSQKSNSTQNNLTKSINNNQWQQRRVMHAKNLVAITKKPFQSMRKHDDIQTKVNKNNCNKQRNS